MVLLCKERTHGVIIVIKQISILARNVANAAHLNTQCLSSPAAPASQNVLSLQALATPVRRPVAIGSL